MHRLPRLPTGALLTFCGRSRETVIKITKPHLLYVFFRRSSTFLGIPGNLDPDLIWPPLGGWVFFWDSLLFCMGSSAISLRVDI